MANQVQQVSAALFGAASEVQLYEESGKLWVLLGHALIARGYLSQSLLCFQSALACEPELIGVHAIRGFVLLKLDRHEEAMAAYMAALAQQPQDADIWLNLGVIYQIAGYVEEALSCFETALLQRPGFVAAWKNRAKAQCALGDFAGARVSFTAATMLSPDSQMLRLDRAICLMMLGQYEEGWAAYDARLHIGAEPRILTDRWPIWQGEAVAGRSVLVLGEQGIGDIFQFVRHIRDLAALGAVVTLQVAERLIPVLEGLDADCVVIAELQPDAHFDFEIPLMSLPHRLSLAGVSPPVPARYLSTSPARLDYWQRRLELGEKSLRVGITWQGNPDFADDARRSVPLAAFGALADVPGVRLISLQGHAEAGQLDTSDLPIERLGDDVDRDGAFVDTAAILDTIDLLITSDTAIAHLAGALGRPVWLALRHVPDWRWGMIGETTPWYPTMRLFRQSRDGDWDGVFAAIRLALQERIAG
jgi:tetratricopeptide (TPR) repeat protein